MKAPSPTIQALLGALKEDETPTGWESSFVGPDFDWDALAVSAIILGLAPQLHHRLQRWETAVPARAAAKLRITFLAHQQRNAAIFEQLGEFLTAATAANLHPLALKGVHLAATLYDAPALRPMNDIDLLFPPEELPAAETLLASLGYGGKHKSADVGPGVTKHTSTFRREGNEAATPNPYLSAGGDRMIEPHRSLEESWFGLSVDMTPGVHERAVTAVLGGHEARVLAPEDLLLHIALHFTFHLIQGAPAMVQLTDLLVILRLLAIDWPTFTQRAIARRAAPFALAGLHLAETVLAAPVPPAVKEQLAAATPRPLRQRIAALGLADIMRRTQQKPLTGLPDRLRRGLADRAETARWAPDWAGRWRVWQTALRPDRTDTGRILLERNGRSKEQLS